MIASSPKASRASTAAVNGLGPFVVVVLVLVALHAAVVAAVRPFGDFQTVDSWAYARSVEILLDEGRMHIFDWNPMSLVAHTAWGALFALLFGYSQPTLVVSVILLSIAGSLAVVGIARELSVSRARALFGAALVVLSPLWTFQAVIFHTDVTFTAWCLLGLWAYLVGARAERRVWFAAASVAFAIGFLIRQPAIFIAAATVLHRRLVLLGRQARPRLVWADLAALGALPIAAVYAFSIWYVYWHGVTWAFLWQSAEIRQNADVAHFLALPALWVRMTLWLTVVAVPVVPAVLGGGPRWRGWRLGTTVVVTLLLAAATVWGLAMTGRLFPLTLGPMLTPFGMMRMNYSVFGVRPVVLTPAIQAAVTAAGALALWGMLVMRVGAWMTQARSDGLLKDLWRRVRSSAGAVVLCLVLYIGYLSVSKPLFDRHLVPAIPLVVVLALASAQRSRMMWPAAIVLALPGAWLSVAATQDYLEINRVVWLEGKRLVEEGIPVAEIDAGLEWNAYHFYRDTGYGEHPMTTAQAPSRRYFIGLDPAVTRSYPRRYLHPYLDGFVEPPSAVRFEVLRKAPFKTLLSRSTRYVYVLRLTEADEGSGVGGDDGTR